MLSKPIPAWILVGGAALAAIAGCVNAAGFLSAHHQAFSHLSGTVTNFGSELARGDFALARSAFLVVAFFFLGCVLSGVVIRQRTLRVGRRYGVALMMEAGLLVAATYFLRHEAAGGIYLAAMACGLQNAMATSYSGAVIRTSHMTGIVTDLGIAVGLAARREPVDWRRMRLYLVLLGGFLAGSFGGGVAFTELGYNTLLLPAAAAGTVGFAYTLWAQVQRTRRPAAAPRGAKPAAPGV